MLEMVAIFPGVQAVVLLRLQLASQGAGHWRIAHVLSVVNVRVTGAEFVPGCSVGAGLVMRHPQGIVVGQGAVIGDDCTILQHVTLGERRGDGDSAEHSYPTVGSRVVVGAGAAILGGIRVGDNAIVGANAVVTMDVDKGDVVVGVPARSTREGGQ
jgi:serine O-acetyltransferase